MLITVCFTDYAALMDALNSSNIDTMTYVHSQLDIRSAIPATKELLETWGTRSVHAMTPAILPFNYLSLFPAASLPLTQANQKYPSSINYPTCDHMASFHFF